MATTPSAEHPPTAMEILRRQDDPRALRWLLAQRRMYSLAKRWNYIRVFGIGIIALGAPIITVITPHAAEIVGAVAGAWIFLARTIFLAGERRWARPAASVQDAFDTFVFDLPANPAVSPQSERIADILRDDDVEQYARKEHLLGWYSLEPDLPEAPAIAIAQQSNLAYSQRLLFRHASVWLGIGAAWGIIAVAIGIGFQLTLPQFLMGVVLPVLPAVLDARELWHSARSAADDRSRLSDALADRIRAWPAHAIKPVGADNLIHVMRPGDIR
jgi:SMODS-associating 4TM effector domain